MMRRRNKILTSTSARMIANDILTHIKHLSCEIYLVNYQNLFEKLTKLIIRRETFIKN